MRYSPPPLTVKNDLPSLFRRGTVKNRGQNSSHLGLLIHKASFPNLPIVSRDTCRHCASAVLWRKWDPVLVRDGPVTITPVVGYRGEGDGLSVLFVLSKRKKGKKQKQKQSTPINFCVVLCVYVNANIGRKYPRCGLEGKKKSAAVHQRYCIT